MRQILFRGKTILGDWVYGLLGCNYFRPNEKYYHIHNCETDDIQYEVVPESVGQFTGLTDKNGTKIFEGDIVRGKDYCGLRREGIVEYNEVGAIYEIVPKTISQYRETNSVTTLCPAEYYLEIIGNKWDNPELLGEQQ
jgi:uncharacterized phage protein (TIGR01671 family)